VIAIVSGGAYAPTSRDAYVASELQTAGVATVLCNLLTRGEDRFLTLRHNIKLLCNRLVAITHWIREHDQLRTLGVAYHATGTGAAGSSMPSSLSRCSIPMCSTSSGPRF